MFCGQVVRLVACQPTDMALISTIFLFMYTHHRWKQICQNFWQGISSPIYAHLECIARKIVVVLHYDYVPNDHHGLHICTLDLDLEVY